MADSQKHEIEVDYRNRTIKSATGFPDGTEIRLREHDYNYGFLISFFRIQAGAPVFMEIKAECQGCFGSGEDETGQCSFCVGTGFQQ